MIHIMKNTDTAGNHQKTHTLDIPNPEVSVLVLIFTIVIINGTLFGIYALINRLTFLLFVDVSIALLGCINLFLLASKRLSATVSRYYSDYVVTEFGIAHLKGRSNRERAKALINIAHPEHRGKLQQQAKKLGLI